MSNIWNSLMIFWVPKTLGSFTSQTMLSTTRSLSDRLRPATLHTCHCWQSTFLIFSISSVRSVAETAPSAVSSPCKSSGALHDSFKASTIWEFLTHYQCCCPVWHLLKIMEWFTKYCISIFWILSLNLLVISMLHCINFWFFEQS